MEKHQALRFTILGCGSSGGVPRLAQTKEAAWGACDPLNPKNTRTRCSLLVEQMRGDEVLTRVLIDTSPDMRQQLMTAQAAWLDAVVYTHAHADHVHGIDDLRMVYFQRDARLPVWADAQTAEALKIRFEYIFQQPKGSSYPPICELHDIGHDAFQVGASKTDAGLPFVPLRLEHGRIQALGFRIGTTAYLPDVSHIPDDVWPQLNGVETLIVDALRYEPHPSHAHLDKTLSWIERLGPKQAILTNMHNDLDYDTVMAETPEHVIPAYDGLRFVV